MIPSIVHSPGPVTLVGGGEATRQDLEISLTYAPTCVAADGGADLAVASGVELAAVIGDMDSLSDVTRAAIPEERLHCIAEQDSTDFEKALLQIDAPLVLGVGFLGGRVDHQLAAFHVLAKQCQRPCILLGATEVICLAPPALQLPMEAGETVSLFPLAPVRGESQGLAWPIEGLAFEPETVIGTSNRAEGPVALQFDAPSMLLILPRRIMPALMTQLLAPDAARWPARTV